MTETTAITIPTDAGAMPAHLWLPTGRPQPGPGLVVLQEIFGVSDYVRRRCADLADLGYVVVAPEIYWRLDDAEVDESREDFLQQALGVVSRLDWEAAVRDSRATLAALRSRDEVAGGAGVLGFCFGGGLAFQVAAEDEPDVLVSYYGSALPNLLDLAPRVDAPSLHHFGTADTFIPLETVEKIRASVAGERVEFRTYPGAGHAFDNPHPMFHHARASDQAWWATRAFLERHLPAG